jgi:hypothetical protein
MQRLRRARVHVEPYVFTQPSVGKLALSLMLAIRNRALAIPNDPALLGEITNIRLHERTTPGTFRMDPAEAKGRDDRAVSLALCVSAILDQAAQGFVFEEYMKRDVAQRDDPDAALVCLGVLRPDESVDTIKSATKGFSAGAPRNP